jgi:hypothetical protein
VTGAAGTLEDVARLSQRNYVAGVSGVILFVFICSGQPIHQLCALSRMTLPLCYPCQCGDK